VKHKATILFVLVLCNACLANTITLKGGKIYRGKVIEKTSEMIRIETFNGEVNIPKALIGKYDKKKSPYELYMSKLGELEDKKPNAPAHYKLGMWCKKKKIWHKAKYHLKKALETSEKPGKAEKALKAVEKAWSRERKKSLLGFTLNVGIVTDMTREEIKKQAEMIKKVSRRLAETTGGLMYIKEAVFTDNSRTGDMLYDPNQGRSKVPGCGNNYSHGPGNWFVGCILHEFGHFKLGLADEYDTSIYGGRPASKVFCENCIMALKHDKGWCSSLNHKKGCLGNAPGCQERLIAAFGKRCPLLSQAFNYSKEEILYPPVTTITIIDTSPRSMK